MTKEQLYLLKIMEECDEVSQRASKAIQFGLDEVQAGQSLTNKQRIMNEFFDLLGCMELMLDCSRIGIHIDWEKVNQKRKKVEKYYNYSKSLNQVQ